jgi:acyl-CoA hydrolase
MAASPALDGYSMSSQTIVMYPHLSRFDRLFGGHLLAWIDEGCAMTAMKLMGTHRIVTKKMSEVIFEAPGMLGDIIEIWTKPTANGRTSLTMSCQAVVCRDGVASRGVICRCEIVFVALDEQGRPTPWGAKGRPSGGISV